MTDKKKEWFADWFDSPYYHILYGNRDFQEAEFFLNNLINRFRPNENAKIIDLACGKGRHSIYLNSKGFNVTGVDLSCQSIAQAKLSENDSLKFEVRDLRNLNLQEKFDIALNLFTSFAYFDNLETDLLVLNQIKSILKSDGYLLIDFFNAKKVIENLVCEESIERNGVLFHCKRSVVDGKIIKDIQFLDQGVSYHYQEKVQALTLKDFEFLLGKIGFNLLDVFGAYDLSPFNEVASDRLVIIAQNTHAR
ncbi:MAG: class I SAM-dependent methyltransferase [Bacteroidia bacterium]|nr:class I SAM-dependent methyltransferase [Bacteroidia bacterium]